MPVLQLDLQERTDLAGSSRVVDQDVQRLDSVQCLLNDGAGARWRADVAGKPGDSSAVGPDSVGCGFQQADIPLRQNHVRALGGEPTRNPGTDASSAARNQRTFAPQVVPSAAPSHACAHASVRCGARPFNPACPAT